MWISILMSAILFAIQHLPEILAILKQVFSFFRQHKGHPEFSNWVSEFAPAMAEATATKDPRPLIALLERMKKDLQA